LPPREKRQVRGKQVPGRESQRLVARGRVPFSALQAARGVWQGVCVCTQRRNAGGWMRVLSRWPRASDPVGLEPGQASGQPAALGCAISAALACVVCVLDQISVRMRAPCWLAELAFWLALAGGVLGCRTNHRRRIPGMDLESMDAGLARCGPCDGGGQTTVCCAV